jgi:hypothetical protein
MNAFASAVLYAGLVLAATGALVALVPVSRFWIQTRRRGVSIAGVGLAAVGIAVALPATESRTSRADARLDEFVPVWQFREVHTSRMAAPPDRVFDAIKRVRADEILLFATLIRIRAGGRGPSTAVRSAAATFDSLLDIATHTSFTWLADDPPHELVVGTLIERPAGSRATVQPDLFARPLPPDFTIAAMNFSVAPDGSGGSLVSTETRVFANTPRGRRRFAVYWRVIYPGSALIRRMWLRAIERRAVRALES